MRHKWTESEIEYLINNYSDERKDNILKELNIDMSYIKNTNYII